MSIDPELRELTLAYIRAETDRMWKQIHDEFHVAAEHREATAEAISDLTTRVHHVEDLISDLIKSKTKANVVELRTLADLDDPNIINIGDKPEPKPAADLLDNDERAWWKDHVGELEKTIETLAKAQAPVDHDPLGMPTWVREERNELLAENERLRQELDAITKSREDWKAEANIIRARYETIRNFFMDK